MVRLADLPPDEAAHLLGKNDAPLGPTPWVAPDRPLARRRVALVTTAGLHREGDAAFGYSDAGFRTIPDDIDTATLRMSHVSVNFDRTGFQHDVNVVFPLQRFHELAGRGAIGSTAALHFSFMGALSAPQAWQQSAAEVARLLHADGVDTVFLTPV